MTANLGRTQNLAGIADIVRARDVARANRKGAAQSARRLSDGGVVVMCGPACQAHRTLSHSKSARSRNLRGTFSSATLVPACLRRLCHRHLSRRRQRSGVPSALDPFPIPWFAAIVPQSSVASAGLLSSPLTNLLSGNRCRPALDLPLLRPPRRHPSVLRIRPP